MKLFLLPQVSPDQLTVGVTGDVLTLNESRLDFTQLTDGATLPRSAIDCDWIAGDVQRISGVLHVPLRLPVASEASEEARFPEPIVVTQDGQVELPK